MKTKPHSPASRVQSTWLRYRGLIFAALGLGVVVGGGLLYRSQKRAEEYAAFHKKGMTAWAERQADRAASEFRRASKIDDRDPELWVMIGRCELVSRNYDAAGKAWEEALKREPTYKPALLERGKEALGRHVLRRIPPPVDPSAGWLPLRLESAAKGDGGIQEVERILTDLKEAAGHAPEVTKFARGAIFLLDGKYAEAHPEFQAYADTESWDATARGLVGIAAHYATFSDRAERALTEALALRPENLWLKVRAETKYLQANYDGARADYKDAGLEKEAEPLFARRIPSKGLILWLKADAGVEAAESVVTKWKDQSEGKNDAAPKEPALGPKLVASAHRGRPAILFAGKEDELFLPDGFEEFASGLSMFVVGEPMTEPSESWSFLFLATPATGAGRVEAFIGKKKGSDQVVYCAEDIQPRIKPFVGGAPPAKGFEAFGAVHEPSEAARFYKRGQLLGTGSLLIPRKTLRTRNRVGAGLKGQVAEVLLYRRNLSEMERLGVEAYLKDRYFPDAAPAAPPAEKR